MMAPRMAATVSRSVSLAYFVCFLCPLLSIPDHFYQRSAVKHRTGFFWYFLSCSLRFRPFVGDSSRSGGAVQASATTAARKTSRSTRKAETERVPFCPTVNSSGECPLPGEQDGQTAAPHFKEHGLQQICRAVLCGNVGERTPHHAVELAGFWLTRADRSAELSGKSKGGGLCFYINERWCTDITVLKEFCSPLLETLFINCRPFHSPREFSSIVMAAVYIPPHARASEATQMLADQVTDMEKLLLNSLIIVLGDLNRANLAHKLPRYRQRVTCPTRGAQTLDNCYTVIKNAYHSAARAALGLSDHCLVHLIPAHRQKLKTSKPVVSTVRKCSVESRQDLQACFDCTDWGVFDAATSDLHELTDTDTSYISFCEELCVKTKTFCTYNNDKPWFTPNLRRLRKVKEEVYRSGDWDLFKQTRNTLNREVRKARRCYGETLERHLSANPDPLTVWKGLQSITGFKKRIPRPVKSPRLANQLNRFYCRFDRFSHTTGPLAEQSTYSPPPTTALSTPPSPSSPTL
ncbi:uncharacterized protein LOC133163169 [Syngnathus typhle]|uniref:uncharacterized protein LOC133163169 n=1 Tax=Syngnathus typhle TaxID=161592 RepID=UPI002A6AD8EB|nr:uncharacterized protein LOC133163169 [Syngnathus typhle]